MSRIMNLASKVTADPTKDIYRRDDPLAAMYKWPKSSWDGGKENMATGGCEVQQPNERPYSAPHAFTHTHTHTHTHTLS